MNLTDLAIAPTPISLNTLKADPQLVADIQRHLITASYAPGPVDGKWGPLTAGALNKFCTDVHLNNFLISKFGSTFARKLLNAKSPNTSPRYTLTAPRLAMLDLIGWTEGTDKHGSDAYRVMFTHKLFSGFADHPRLIQRSGDLSSDAAGRYQFLSSTWDECQRAMNLPDFSPRSQDQAALFLISRRQALPDVDNLKIVDAIKKLSWEWASLPPRRYGQPIKSMAECLTQYRTFLARQG